MIKKLKKTAALLSGLCMIFFCAAETKAVDVSAQASVLIEAESGDIIYEKNAHERLPMASTTKIMTAVVALENGDLNKEISVSPNACGVEGSSIYLSENERLTLEELLYALLLESANDAAAAIAYEIAGGIEEFACLMNDTAEKLGLEDTHFTNPHGLDNENHYTTAADLAKLTAYALKNEKFREIVSTYKHQIPLRGDEGIRVLLNHNKLLKLSDDAIGVKTGFTKKSGRCLVSAAERDGVCVIAVTLNAPDDWNDHLALYELGFSMYKSVLLAKKGQFSVQIPCSGAENGCITAENRDELRLCLKNGDEITHTIEAERMLFSPISEGDEVGRVVFRMGGKVIGEVALYSAQTVEEIPDERSIGDRILDFIK